MKKPIILFIAVALSAMSYFTLFPKSKTNNTANLEQVKEYDDEEEEESGADKQLAMWFQSKGYPNPVNLNDKYQAAWQQYLELKKKRTKFDSKIEAANWASLGQSYNSGTPIGGRILCLTIDPNNANNLWVGSASGGIWKSTNQGTSWTPVVTNMNVLAVTSILIDPSNSNVIYAGTGEMYNTEVSVMGYNVWKTRGTYGIGIIKSTNGGSTWS
ncbi:MAG: WD40/YVTN/BNR-like repeat-containing protein, partial [Chitinophagaceae bacterium]